MVWMVLEGQYFVIRFCFQAWNMSGTQKVSGNVTPVFETFVVISTRVIAKIAFKNNLSSNENSNF